MTYFQTVARFAHGFSVERHRLGAQTSAIVMEGIDGIYFTEIIIHVACNII